MDLLRSLALVRVVIYHLFGWAWLTVLFPSMGVMFALAGSLMARSLNRPTWGVIRGRIRRLLPPLWAFSAVVLSLLFYGGWNLTKDPDHSGTWGLVEMVNYVFPIGAPPFPWQVGDKAGLLEDTWADAGRGPALVHPRVPVVRDRLAAAAVGVPQAAVGDAARAAGPDGGASARDS